MGASPFARSVSSPAVNSAKSINLHFHAAHRSKQFMFPPQSKFFADRVSISAVGFLH
jgi:hypothetical protein